MQARLAETERIVSELQSGVAPVTHTPVHVRDERARDTIRIVDDVAVSEFGAWVSWAFERLATFLASTGVPAAGPPAALCDAQILEDDGETVEACIPVAAPVEVPAGEHEIAVGEVPAARVAVLVHAGSFETMPDTYRTLGAWVARNASHSGERIREWYSIGPLDTRDERSYRTEIAWPIS